MARICTGDVCVRNRNPPSTQKVSCMSRAGWFAGMLRASKLWYSVSTSGPSSRLKPSEAKKRATSR
jgi:hypothetical protein